MIHLQAKALITSVGEMEFSDYNCQLVNRDKVLSQIEDKEFEWAHSQEYIANLKVLAKALKEA